MTGLMQSSSKVKAKPLESDSYRMFSYSIYKKTRYQVKQRRRAVLLKYPFLAKY